MKVGDIYYCIKDRFNNDNKIINKSGNKYEILFIREKYNRISITNESKFNNYFYCIIDDNKSWIFSEFFVSLKHYRKLKLEKIKKLNEDR
jgi:hypothetical protein